MAVQVLRRKFTADEYQMMGKVGILSEDDRLELLEGEIVEMARLSPRYLSIVNRVNASFFSNGASEKAIVRVHGPVRLDDYSEPLPDVALLRRRDDFYSEAHPGPADVLLLVEVSDTSTSYDREVKMPMYARHGIPEVWLVDIEAGLVEVYAGPAIEGYQEISQVGRGGILSPQAFPGLDVAVEEVLG